MIYFRHNVPSMSALTLMFCFSGAAMTSCTNSTNRYAALVADPAQQVETPAVRARADVAAAVEKMKAMVASGEITEEQMNRRLRGMRIRLAIASGEMSAEEGRKAMAATRARADYAAAAEKMRAMVANGEITEEQMDIRLGEMRRMIGRDQGDQRSARTISRADYAAAAEKMRAMVANGEITEEQMNVRLGEMRRMIGRDRGEAPDGSTPQVAAAAINDTCPVSGKQVGDDAPTVELRGMKIAFCCGGCVEKFNANPREFLGALREAMSRDDDEG